jgi:bacteriocin-like protein
MTMSEGAKLTAQELKQSILNRMDVARKGIEELSEEELESIAGGGRCSTDAKGESCSSRWTIPPPQRPKHETMPYNIDHLARGRVEYLA